MRALILGAALATAATPALAEFKVSSTNVKSGSPMALAQVLDSCNGQNVSPALTWSGEPAGTQSFALTMVDTDARNGRGWWHWSASTFRPRSIAWQPALAARARRIYPRAQSRGGPTSDFRITAGRAHRSASTLITTKSLYTRSRSRRCRSTKPPRAPRSKPASAPTRWQPRRSSDATAVRDNSGKLQPAPVHSRTSRLKPRCRPHPQFAGGCRPSGGRPTAIGVKSVRSKPSVGIGREIFWVRRVSTVAVQRFCNSVAAVPWRSPNSPGRWRVVVAFWDPETFFGPVRLPARATAFGSKFGSNSSGSVRERARAQPQSPILLSCKCAIPPLVEPIPSLCDGSEYRRLVRQIRDIARRTRLPIARNDLLRLATNYSRRGDHLDGRIRPRINLPLCLVLKRNGARRLMVGAPKPSTTPAKSARFRASNWHRP